MTRERGQVLDLTGRLRVERSIHHEQRDQREKQRHIGNQQHRVVSGHQAERDRASTRDHLQADQRRRRPPRRQAEASQPMVRMVEAAPRDRISRRQPRHRNGHGVKQRNHQRQQWHRETRRQRTFAKAAALNRQHAQHQPDRKRAFVTRGES